MGDIEDEWEQKKAAEMQYAYDNFLKIKKDYERGQKKRAQRDREREVEMTSEMEKEVRKRAKEMAKKMARKIARQ